MTNQAAARAANKSCRSCDGDGIVRRTEGARRYTHVCTCVTSSLAAKAAKARAEAARARKRRKQAKTRAARAAAERAAREAVPVPVVEALYIDPREDVVSLPVRPWVSGRADAGWLGVASFAEQRKRRVELIALPPRLGAPPSTWDRGPRGGAA